MSSRLEAHGKTAHDEWIYGFVVIAVITFSFSNLLFSSPGLKIPMQNGLMVNCDREGGLEKFVFRFA